MVKIFSYLIFWAIIPSIVVYYRVQKKIKTAFAIGIVATSIFFGFIAANSFYEKNEHMLIKYLNENNYEDAEKALKWLLQKNPEDIKKIDTTTIINPVKFDEMKRRLGEEYIDIADKLMKENRVNEIRGCEKLNAEREKMNNLEHALRLLIMAENIGEKQEALKDKLKWRIINDRKIISSAEKRCD